MAACMTNRESAGSLPQASRGCLRGFHDALHRRFDPDSKKELYVAEL